MSEGPGNVPRVAQLSLHPALDRDPLGLALFYVETPFHHYLAEADALGLSAMGDTEEEALRDLALLLRRWAVGSVEQGPDPACCLSVRPYVGWPTPVTGPGRVRLDPAVPCQR